MNLTAILDTGARALGVLKMLTPILGADAPIVGQILGIVAKALDGARSGKVAYETLVAELDGVIADMEAIRARGGVTGDDFRSEVAAIRERGSRLDAILAGLKG